MRGLKDVLELSPSLTIQVIDLPQRKRHKRLYLISHVYFMDLCIASPLFLVRDADKKAACKAQAVFIVATTGLTALFNYSLYL